NSASCAASSASSGSPRTARATRRATPAYRSANTPNAARSPARTRATRAASSCSGIRAAGVGGWESGFISALPRLPPPPEAVQREAERERERAHREGDAHHPGEEEQQRADPGERQGRDGGDRAAQPACHASQRHHGDGAQLI